MLDPRRAPGLWLVGAMVLLTACGTAPALTPSPSPTPLGAEPCNADVLADAVDAIKGVEGYRFIQDLGTLRAPRRVGGERYWTTTRTEGAFLAPDLYREAVVSTTDLLPHSGYWEAVAIGEQAWFLRSSEPDGPREWTETELNIRSRNPLLGAQAYAGGAAADALEPAERHDMLPGEGGCVMTAVLGDEEAPATVAIRLDAAQRRVASFFSEADGLRWTIQVQYELPSAAEFLRPTEVGGED